MPAALFFDVDGTLIDSYHNNRRISPAVLAELKRIQGMGHKIFLSSGRPRPLMTPEVLEPGFDGLVLVNGGYVEMDGRSLYEERMDLDLAHRVIALLDGLGIEYLISCARSMYTFPTNQGIRDFFGGFCEPDVFTYEFDLEDALARAIKVETLPSVASRERLATLAKEVLGPDISCDSHGGEGTFELYPTAVSKAKGIEKVLEHLGIGVDEAYAFGDGTNDLEMIRFCGCGVAMGNAEDDVKAAADIICPPVWEDGLAQVLRELF